jgi:hypothetical protein
MPGVVVHETKELDIEEPDALVLASMELGNDPDAVEPDTASRSCAIICLPRHFFLDFRFLGLQK